MCYSIQYVYVYKLTFPLTAAYTTLSSVGGLFFGVLLPAAIERSAYNTLSGATGGGMGGGTD